MTRSYSQLIKLDTFEERYRYLRLHGQVGETTFGYDRYLNQLIYRSQRWRSLRNKIIIRDHGCDLGIQGYDIYAKIMIHHMNPLTLEDVHVNSHLIFDPEFLICTSFKTHNAIHFGDESLPPQLPIERRPNDTSPWLINYEGGA